MSQNLSSAAVIFSALKMFYFKDLEFYGLKVVPLTYLFMILPRCDARQNKGQS